MFSFLLDFQASWVLFHKLVRCWSFLPPHIIFSTQFSLGSHHLHLSFPQRSPAVHISHSGSSPQSFSLPSTISSVRKIISKFNKSSFFSQHATWKVLFIHYEILCLGKVFKMAESELEKFVIWVFFQSNYILIILKFLCKQIVSKISHCLVNFLD